MSDGLLSPITENFNATGDIVEASLNAYAAGRVRCDWLASVDFYDFCSNEAPYFNEHPTTFCVPKIPIVRQGCMNEYESQPYSRFVDHLPFHQANTGPVRTCRAINRLREERHCLWTP